MELVYRGIKYSSKNLMALKIIKEYKHLLYIKKTDRIAKDRKFPYLKYFKRLIVSDLNLIRNPNIFWYKYKIGYLEQCWKSSEINLLTSCWEMSPEELEAKHNSPIKLKYRGVTYYK